VDSSRAAAFLRVVVEHSRSAEDETKRCRSSQDVSGNPPILCTNKAITSILAQAPGPPLSSRQHPVSPFSVSGPFSISVFRSRKFRRSCTVLQLLGRDEGPVSSKREFGFFLEIRFLALIWRLISTSYLRWAAKGRGFSEELNFFICDVKGSPDFLSSALGMIRGCFYQLPSLGSLTYAPPRIAPIMLTRPGVYNARSRDPLRGSRSASKKTCVRQGSSDTDHSLELGKKNFNICTKTGCWSCGPCVTLLVDSKSY